AAAHPAPGANGSLRLARYSRAAHQAGVPAARSRCPQAAARHRLAETKERNINSREAAVVEGRRVLRVRAGYAAHTTQGRLHQEARWGGRCGRKAGSKGFCPTRHFVYAPATFEPDDATNQAFGGPHGRVHAGAAGPASLLELPGLPAGAPQLPARHQRGAIRCHSAGNLPAPRSLAATLPHVAGRYQPVRHSGACGENGGLHRVCARRQTPFA
nr:hypothetical protein [Tanacetum cinerariifolium]